MTHTQLIEQQLNRLAGLGGGNLVISLAKGNLECEIEHVDALGVAFSKFTFLSTQLAQANNAQLSKIADSLATKLSYLLEPLRVIEIDGQLGAVQMRSAPPYKQAQQINYYEVLVQRGAILLARFEKQPELPRVTISAVVTREVFARLANDFHEVV